MRKVICGSRSLIRRSRFNEAASRRMRKGGDDAGSKLDHLASTKPHPEGCGRVSRPGAAAPRLYASTKPHPEGCGRNTGSTMNSVGLCSLQRSRIPKDAEGVSTSSNPPSTGSFNEAASRRMRKGSPFVSDSGIVSWLQRSRIPKDAEGRRVFDRPSRPRPASTKPHPEGCGRSSSPRRLNTGPPASTKPHPEGCGRRPRRRGCQSLSSASTKPHPEGCGRSRRQRRRRPAANASTKPHPEGCGRIDDPDVPAAVRRLQRSRIPKDAEGGSSPDHPRIIRNASTKPHPEGCGRPGVGNQVRRP